LAEEGKILVYLGYPLDAVRRHECGEALVGSFDEAEGWLRERAERRLWPEVQPPRRGKQSVGQRLFEAGVPGSVYRIFDRCFGVTFEKHGGSITSWHEAKAWLEKMPAQDVSGPPPLTV
jgi:hypothetical protein